MVIIVVYYVLLLQSACQSLINFNFNQIHHTFVMIVISFSGFSTKHTCFLLELSNLFL